MALFIFDFDLTLTSAHTHNKIFDFLKKNDVCQRNEELEWNVAKSIPPTKTAGDWQHLFRTLMSDGHQVAIASFNGFAHIIPRYLNEIIGLTADEVKKIRIESWLPENSRQFECKNFHIANITQYFDVKDRSSVILIDDTPRNIWAAQAENYQGIVADNAGLYHARLLALSRELRIQAVADLTAAASALAI